MHSKQTTATQHDGKHDTMKTAQSIIESAQKVCARKGYKRAANQLDYINSASHYCESGYLTDKDCILFGNWNKLHWDAKEGSAEAKENSFYAGVVKALERVAELEWEDEWTTCSQCGGAIRTQANSYGWQRGYVLLDGELLCHNCARKEPEAVVESFEGDCRRCITSELGLDLASIGWVKLEQEFEHGLYGGQDADPKKIGAALEKRGIGRFVFVLDSVGQFDASFSVWVHGEEADRMPASLSHGESACALDPAEGLKRALQSVPAVSGEGVTYVKCDPSTGTSTARKVSAQEFIAGIKD